MKHKELQIIYKNHKPYGIRDENGYLLFFAAVDKWDGQEERYRQEVTEQFQLSDCIFEVLKLRG